MIGNIIAHYVLGIDYENKSNCRIENLSCELASKIEKEWYIEGTLYNNNECRNDNGLIRGCTYRNFIK